MKPDKTVTTQAVSADRIAGKLPIPLLSPEGFASGSVVSSGGITLLTGEAGVDKTALALQLAYGIARLPDGERRTGGFFTATGGPVLYVATDKSPLVISARLQAAGRRTGGNDAEHTATMARIHVLDLTHAPLFERSRTAAFLSLPAIERRLPAFGAAFGRTKDGPGWRPFVQTVRQLRPSVVFLGSARLGQPAPAAEVVDRLAALQRSIGNESRPAGFVLLADSAEGAFGTNDPMGYGFADASWDAVLTLARARLKSERVLRIPHALYGPSRLSIRLETLSQPLASPGEGAPAPAVIGFRAPDSSGWQRGAYGTVRRSRNADAPGTDGPELPLDDGERAGANGRINGKPLSGASADVPPAPALNPRGKLREDETAWDKT